MTLLATLVSRFVNSTLMAALEGWSDDYRAWVYLGRRTPRPTLRSWYATARADAESMEASR